MSKEQHFTGLSGEQHDYRVENGRDYLVADMGGERVVHWIERPANVQELVEALSPNEHCVVRALNFEQALAHYEDAFDQWQKWSGLQADSGQLPIQEYSFTIQVVGRGRHEAEAWEDAKQSAAQAVEQAGYDVELLQTLGDR